MCKLNIKNSLLRIKSFSLIFIAILIPCALLSPFVIGSIESHTDRDLLGIGSCRIENTEAILNRAGTAAKLVSGVVFVEGKAYNHLWGVDCKGELVDVTCPHNVKRVVRETLNPFSPSVPVISNQNKTIMDFVVTAWNRAYLVAFIANKNFSRG